jgi:hypothetical protein
LRLIRRWQGGERVGAKLGSVIQTNAGRSISAMQSGAVICDMFFLEVDSVDHLPELA